MKFELNLTLLGNIAIALGIVELVKELLKKISNNFVDEKLARRKEIQLQKQSIREKLMSVLAFGTARNFESLPTDTVLTEATGKVFELRGLNKKLSLRVDEFFFQWRLHCYLIEDNKEYGELIESVHEYLIDEVDGLIDDLAKL